MEKIKNEEETKKKNVFEDFRKKLEQIKNKFKHLPSLTKEQLENKDPNSDFPKYFAKIDTKNFKYIGVLSNQLKRVKYY